jgi:NagD protein
MERPMTNDQASQTTESYLIDMNGVLVQDEQLLPGAEEFIAWLKATGRRFLVLTSDSVYTQRDLAARLARSGLDVPAEAIWTSAVATAQFLAEQRPEGTAYTLGEAGLTAALHEVGYILSERDPDYVVLGETRSYSLERLTLAIRLIVGGARFIATNPEPTGLSQQGLQPGTGAVAALISRATGIEPYIVGKPNPFMMRSGLRAIGAHSASTVLIGDRMDTDIVAGIEAGMQAILVLSGVDKRETLDRFPYMPSRIVDSVADLLDTAGQASNTADTASDAASGSSR